MHIERDQWERLELPERLQLHTIAHGLSCTNGVLCGRSAALLHGLILASDHPSDVEIGYHPPAGTRQVSATRTLRALHANAKQQAEDLQIRTSNGLRIVRLTSLEDTIIDLARWHSIADAVVAAEGVARGRLLHSHGADPGLEAGRSRLHNHGAEEFIDALNARLDMLPNIAGIERARDALRLVNGASESPRESELKVKLWEAGLPAPLQQVELHYEGYFAGRVDFFYPCGLVIEYDGQGKYQGGYASAGRGSGRSGQPLGRQGRSGQGFDSGFDSETYAARQIISERKRERKLHNLGARIYRVDRDNFRDGTAVADICRIHRQMTLNRLEFPTTNYRGGVLAWK